MVKFENVSVEDAGRLLMRCEKWVRKWAARYDLEGIDGLRDRDRPGRPPAVPSGNLRAMIDRAREEKSLNPAGLSRIIKEEAGVEFTPAHVRRIMRRNGLSIKKHSRVHANRAGREECEEWAARVLERIPRLLRRGFAVSIVDEAHMFRDLWKGARGWSPVGVPAVAEYTGSHEKFTIIGSLGHDGRQLFRICDKGNSAAFTDFLEQLRLKHGRAAVIVDNVRYHESKAVKGYIEKHGGNVVLIQLPKYSPYLSAIEAVWGVARKDLQSQTYDDLDEMRWTASEYFRTHRFYNISMVAHLQRSYPAEPNL